MTDPRLLDDEPDVAAAELALGLLEGDERAAALRRLLAEPAFAREVERWRVHFAALFAVIPEIEPAPDLGDRVVARLDGPIRPRVGAWKGLALTSSLAAASMFGLLLLRPDPAIQPIAPVPVTAKPEMLVAALMVEGRDTPVVAVYEPERGMVRIAGPMMNQADRSAQLWAIVGDAPPHPLGLFHEAGADAVEADARMATPIAPGTTFAISIEPVGGSPTGLPTGPVIASGKLTRV